jgi:chromatin remodeling complex protein RSC6
MAKKTGKTANAAFMKPMTPSATLAAVIGANPMPRTEVTKKLWAYIKKHNLQDPKKKRNIKADDKLKAVFGGKGVVNMFEMTKLVGKHLK